MKHIENVYTLGLLMLASGYELKTGDHGGSLIIVGVGCIIGAATAWMYSKLESK